LAAGVIIAREMLVSALREWMATKGMRDKVAVAFSGKLKTTVQMLAIITLLLANPTLPEWVLMLGYGLIYLAAVLSISSMAQYFRAAWGELQSKS
jgi:CDP-diacylglycerol--glycerol-3-phosphate 3-phosphatidyltransferase